MDITDILGQMGQGAGLAMPSPEELIHRLLTGQTPDPLQDTLAQLPQGPAAPSVGVSFPMGNAPAPQQPYHEPSFAHQALMNALASLQIQPGRNASPLARTLGGITQGAANTIGGTLIQRQQSRLLRSEQDRATQAAQNKSNIEASQKSALEAQKQRAQAASAAALVLRQHQMGQKTAKTELTLDQEIDRAYKLAEAKAKGIRAGAPPILKPAKAKGATAAERQTLNFYNRMKDSVDTLTAPGPVDPITGQPKPSLEQIIASQNPVNQLLRTKGPNLMQSPEQQAYTQAQRAFTEARLRKESGAAINPSEYENDAKTYFVQPGDKLPVIEQKRLKREKLLEGFKFAAGPAYTEFYSGEQPTETADPEYQQLLDLLGQQ